MSIINDFINEDIRLAITEDGAYYSILDKLFLTNDNKEPIAILKRELKEVWLNNNGDKELVEYLSKEFSKKGYQVAGFGCCDVE